MINILHNTNILKKGPSEFYYSYSLASKNIFVNTTLNCNYSVYSMNQLNVTLIIDKLNINLDFGSNKSNNKN